MRHSFAIVAAAAIASNAFASTEEQSIHARFNEESCATFKDFIWYNRTDEGWTKEETADSIIYKDGAGKVIDDWSGFSGYGDTGCAVIDSYNWDEADAEEDGAAYLTFGAAIVATGAALAF